MSRSIFLWLCTAKAAFWLIPLPIHSSLAKMKAPTIRKNVLAVFCMMALLFVCFWHWDEHFINCWYKKQSMFCLKFCQHFVKQNSLFAPFLLAFLWRNRHLADGMKPGIFLQVTWEYQCWDLVFLCSHGWQCSLFKHKWNHSIIICFSPKPSCLSPCVQLSLSLCSIYLKNPDNAQN